METSDAKYSTARKIAGPSAQRRVGIRCPVPAVVLQKTTLISSFMGTPGARTAYVVEEPSPFGDPWALHGSIFLIVWSFLFRLFV